MEKKIFVLAFLVFLSSQAFASWDFNKTITITPQVNISVDSNQQKFSVTIGSTKNDFLCTSDQNTTIAWETTTQIDKNSVDLNFFLEPVARLFDQNYLADLNEQVSRLQKMNESCDVNALILENTALKNALDKSISDRFSDFDAKIQNTYLPKQTELDDLKKQKDNAIEGQRQCLSDLNLSGIATASQKATFEGQIETRDTVIVIIATMLFLVIGLACFFLIREGYHTFAFRKKTENE